MGRTLTHNAEGAAPAIIDRIILTNGQRGFDRLAISSPPYSAPPALPLQEAA